MTTRAISELPENIGWSWLAVERIEHIPRLRWDAATSGTGHLKYRKITNLKISGPNWKKDASYDRVGFPRRSFVRVLRVMLRFSMKWQSEHVGAWIMVVQTENFNATTCRIFYENSIAADTADTYSDLC